MLDSNDLLRAIKKASTQAVEQSKPTNLTFGKVVCASPLQIKVEQKLTLGMAHLILTRNVTDFNVNMTVEHTTQDHSHSHTITDSFTGGGSASSESHHHAYQGRKSFVVHNALVLGEDVVLMRMQGGQQYLVLDRVVNL